MVADAGEAGGTSLEVHVLVDAESLDTLLEELNQVGDEVVVESQSEVIDPTGANLSLGFLLDVQILMKVLDLTGKLAGAIWRTLKKRKKCIRVDTPLGSVELCPEHGLSEEEIRERLKKLVEVL